jgi:hypothetical protein
MLVPDDITVSELLYKECPLEVWTAYFDALNAGRAASLLGSPGTMDGLTSPWEEVPSLDSLRKASDTFWTPKRLKLGNMLSPDTVPVVRVTRGSPLANVFLDDLADNQAVEVERMLRKVFGDWNKIHAKFHSIHLKLDSKARADMKYLSVVNGVVGNIQEIMQETDNRVQLLQASLGEQVDNPEAGPMSIWEAIIRLRIDAERIVGIGDGSSLYLNETRKKLPNWAVTLENLSASYLDTVPKLNRNLVTMGARIGALEGGRVTTNLNPSGGIGLGVPGTDLSGLGVGNGAFVLQGDFDNTKRRKLRKHC